MMVAFLIMVTKTDGKPTNDYEYLEGVKSVYRKKFQGAPQYFDALKKEPGCCAFCRSWCTCCYP